MCLTKEKKAVAQDLKKIYQADTVELAEAALDDFELTWAINTLLLYGLGAATGIK